MRSVENYTVLRKFDLYGQMILCSYMTKLLYENGRGITKIIVTHNPKQNKIST